MNAECHHVSRIEVLEKRNDTIFDAIKDMENKFDGKLDLIIFQINKIAVLEANQDNYTQTIQRAFSRIETLEAVNKSLEAFKHRSEGMAKMAWILWGTLGSGVLALLVEVFFKK